MNEGEKLFKNKMENLGWTTYKTGWPDFLLHKKLGKKDIICFAEIKSIDGTFTKNQIKVLELLGKLAPTFVLNIGEASILSKDNLRTIKSIEDYSQDFIIDYALEEMERKSNKR